MAKKRIPTIEDAIKSFKEVAQRALLSNYYYVNNVLLSRADAPNSEDPDDGKLVLLNVESALWEEVIKDESIAMVEIDDPAIRIVSGKYKPFLKYGSDETVTSDLWIPIDVTEELFKGKLFRIKIENFEYEIPINRDLMPLKLRKAEYEDVSYRVFVQPKARTDKSKPMAILAIKKYFSIKDVENSGFHIIKLYQVI